MKNGTQRTPLRSEEFMKLTVKVAINQIRIILYSYLKDNPEGTWFCKAEESIKEFDTFVREEFTNSSSINLDKIKQFVIEKIAPKFNKSFFGKGSSKLRKALEDSANLITPHFETKLRYQQANRNTQALWCTTVIQALSQLLETIKTIKPTLTLDFENVEHDPENNDSKPEKIRLF